MPGPFDYVKGISYIKGVAKYEKLYGCNVAESIAERLGFENGFPVRFMNDVSVFAVGEALVGKAAGGKIDVGNPWHRIWISLHCRNHTCGRRT